VSPTPAAARATPSTTASTPAATPSPATAPPASTTSSSAPTPPSVGLKRARARARSGPAAALADEVDPSPMDLGLAGKVAIVTGSSRGIGRAIALSLAGEGCQVVLCARGAAELDAA